MTCSLTQRSSKHTCAARGTLTGRWEPRMKFQMLQITINALCQNQGSAGFFGRNIGASWVVYGSSPVRGRSIIRREFVVMNESVDTQDVKALSNDHIKAQEMCRAAFFHYIFLYGWVEFNLLMFSGMTTLALHGSFWLIGLFQMHKTPVDWLPAIILFCYAGSSQGITIILNQENQH